MLEEFGNGGTKENGYFFFLVRKNIRRIKRNTNFNKMNYTNVFHIRQMFREFSSYLKLWPTVDVVRSESGDTAFGWS